MKKLRMMLEYQAYPLWIVHEDGLENIEAHSVDILSALADSIEAWGDHFEATYLADDPGSSDFSSTEEEKAFLDEGIRLFEALKSECSGKYAVEYHTYFGDRYT